MHKQDFYLGNAATLSEEEQQSLLHLKLLMHQLDSNLPKLPPQYDNMMGNALLNLALMKMISACGQEATANLLAGVAELLWNNGWHDLNPRHN
jgi:hypothetical protein